MVEKPILNDEKHLINAVVYGDASSSKSEVTEAETKLLTWRRFLVGPILSVYMFGYIISYYTITEYTNETWRNIKYIEANLTFNGSSSARCDVNKSSSEFKAENEASSMAARYMVYYSLAQGIPAVISNLVLGAYTDALGRKFLLGVGISGTTLRLICSFLIIYFKIDMLYFVLACLLEGFTGQYATMLQVSLAYMSDITTSGKQRSHGIAYVMFMLGTSLTLASFAAGYLIQIFNYYAPFAIASVLLVISLIVMLTLLPESFPREKRITNTALKTVVSNSFSFFVSRDFGNNRWKYQLLLLAHGFCDFSFLGRVGTETIYQMSEPFCWSAETVGWYGAARTAGMMVFGVASVKVFQACLPDISIAMIGVLSYAICFMITAFANNSNDLYVAAAVSSFGPLESTIIRSVASSLTDPHKQGAIFSAFAAVEITVNLLSNVGTSAIYSVTVKFMRGFVFLVLSSFDGISFIILLILLIGWKREERETTVVRI